MQVMCFAIHTCSGKRQTLRSWVAATKTARGCNTQLYTCIDLWLTHTFKSCGDLNRVIPEFWEINQLRE